MRAGLEMRIQQKNWKQAAISANNLSELELKLGRLPDATAHARQAVTHGDQSGDAFQRMSTRTAAADALHQSAQRAEAGALFAEAERIQKEDDPRFDLLYSLPAFQYCDWLLAPVEGAAWQALLRSSDIPSVAASHHQDGNETICGTESNYEAKAAQAIATADISRCSTSPSVT